MVHEDTQSLTAYSNTSIPSDAPEIEGIINYLSWHRRPPRLYLHDWPATHPGIPLTHLVGEDVEITLEGLEICTSCGESAQTSPCGACGTEPPFANCVKQPARECTYQNCPYDSFKQRNCSEQFAVYLAVSDRVKVGISRTNRLQTRWREQGASHAVRIATAPNRYEAGLIEAAIDVAREEIAAVLDTRVLSQGSQTWSTMLSDPVETLIDATVLAGDHFPAGTEDWYRFSDRDRDQIRSAIARIPALSPGRPTESFPHAKIGALSHLSEDDPVTATFIGIRGQLLVTEAGYINCNTHGGHRIRIRTTAPHTDYLTQTESPPTALAPETEPAEMVSSEIKTSADEGADTANAADFM